MCGILAVYDRQGVNQAQLEKSIRTLRHRGPDNRGIFINSEGTVGLGHARLAIIDLNPSANQPMVNGNLSTAIVFNGEIYNFKTLRQELQSKGRVFHTNSDTEVLLQAYRAWGKECLNYLEGMFAFCIYDAIANTFFAARDRVGKKPLHYAWVGNRFAIASEIKALVSFDWVRRKLDSEALADYVKWGFIPAPKTIWQDVKKLEPGCWLEFSLDNASLKTDRYWDISFEKREWSRADAIEALIPALQQSVAKRLVSDVPLGAFLSGGVDSSTVVAFAAQLTETPIRTFNISFDDDTYNEASFAESVSRHCRTAHTKREVVPSDVDSIFDALLWHYDEPFNDYSYLPTYYVSRETRRFVTVALSGDGGDELFAGYPKYWINNVATYIQDSLPRVLKPTLSKLAARYPKSFRGRNYAITFAADTSERYLNSTSFLGAQRPEYATLPPLAVALPPDYDSACQFAPLLSHALERDWDPTSIMQYLDFRVSLPEDMLTKVDRASMANSLEVRCPFLDHKLIELVSTFPSRLLIRGREGKSVLKEAMSRFLPPEVLYRRKMGFSSPIDKWMVTSLRPGYLDPILERSYKPILIQKEYLRRVLDDIGNGMGLAHYRRRYLFGAVQNLLFLENWAKRWLV